MFRLGSIPFTKYFILFDISHDKYIHFGIYPLRSINKCVITNRMQRVTIVISSLGIKLPSASHNTGAPLPDVILLCDTLSPMQI